MKKIAIIEHGFVKNYLKAFIKLCKEHHITVDLLTFCRQSNFTKYCDNTYYLTNLYNPKDFTSKYNIEKEIKELINIEEYNYILSDCMGLSFCCNIFHNISLTQRMSIPTNFIYRKLLQLLHKKQIEHEKQYYKNCPKIVVVSNSLKEDYSKNCNIDKNKIIVAYPGTNLNKNNQPSVKKKSKENFVIGANTCGFTTKGGYNLLRAVKLFKKKHKDVNIKCRLINPKYKKQILANLYINLFGLKKNIEFLGYQIDMNVFYNSLDCLICPSKYEAFGRVVTEAMLNKTPVIVASNVGASDIIDDTQNGFCADSRTLTKSIVKKMEELYFYYSEKDIDILTQNGYNTAIDLSWDNFAETVFRNLYSI